MSFLFSAKVVYIHKGECQRKTYGFVSHKYFTIVKKPVHNCRFPNSLAIKENSKAKTCETNHSKKIHSFNLRGNHFTW